MDAFVRCYGSKEHVDDILQMLGVWLGVLFMKSMFRWAWAQLLSGDMDMETRVSQVLEKLRS